jgi:hypothetical protein
LTEIKTASKHDTISPKSSPNQHTKHIFTLQPNT